MKVTATNKATGEIVELAADTAEQIVEAWRVTLVRDTELDGVQYCWNGHPMKIKKVEPHYNMRTGKIEGYSYEITCSKLMCICRYGIWSAYDKRKLV